MSQRFFIKEDTFDHIGAPILAEGISSLDAGSVLETSAVFLFDSLRLFEGEFENYIECGGLGGVGSRTRDARTNNRAPKDHFWYPRIYWPLEPECEILMFMWPFGHLSKKGWCAVGGRLIFCRFRALLEGIWPRVGLLYLDDRET